MPEGTATIEIDRAASKWSDRKRAYKVLVDGEEVGRIGNGESASFDVAPGQHEVHLKIDWCRSESVPVDLAAGASARIGCSSRNPLGAIYWITVGFRRYINITSTPV